MQNKKILIVEDELKNFDNTVKMKIQDEFDLEADWVQDVQSAEDSMKMNSYNYLITDLGLPYSTENRFEINENLDSSLSPMKGLEKLIDYSVQTTGLEVDRIREEIQKFKAEYDSKMKTKGAKSDFRTKMKTTPDDLFIQAYSNKIKSLLELPFFSLKRTNQNLDGGLKLAKKALGLGIPYTIYTKDARHSNYGMSQILNTQTNLVDTKKIIDISLLHFLMHDNNYNFHSKDQNGNLLKTTKIKPQVQTIYPQLNIENSNIEDIYNDSSFTTSDDMRNRRMFLFITDDFKYAIGSKSDNKAKSIGIGYKRLVDYLIQNNKF